jgi:4-alpha-glucanotransferase
MQFPSFSHPVTGIAIPVGALRTSRSCGIGEFADLEAFADFCKKTGIDVIQLLPVNDTGTESSPYSALSAFALHPAYIRLQDIPESAPLAKDIERLREKHEGKKRFAYRSLRDDKNEILHRIFTVNEERILDSPALAKWIASNPWIAEYAVFMNLKNRNFNAGWKSWDKLRTPSHSEITARWNNPKYRADHFFYAWVQMHLDEQFTKAVAYCRKLGIALKGDIPIMMNEDSCDIWAHPEFFRDDLCAGSPPDGMNPSGQNWGFPIYNWDNLRADGFSWWKARLANVAKYYNAYRIDHILGFFRIWSIPAGECSGYLGWTTPHEAITAQELAERGFSGDRLRWISEPHVPTSAVSDVYNNDYLGAHGLLHRIMDRIGNQELWLFKNSVTCESDIWETDLPEPVKQVLALWWKNRMMQVTGRDENGRQIFVPIWNFRDTSAWASLSWEEKESLEQLIAVKTGANERLWEEQALELLGELTKCTDMLACAEDLGSIPASVPGVLQKLGILGLKVIRWERKWKEPNQPLYDIHSYPALTVATSSVHDSSTLRGWWDTEDGASVITAAWNPDETGYQAETKDRLHGTYNPETAAWVMKNLANTSSSFFIPPIQDFLTLSPDFYDTTPDEDRINIPGSVTDFNWTWRLPVTIEELEKNKKLVSAISDIVKARHARKPEKGA